jgi:nitroimidazol reductase NimA-like FMN-containing flavoprotein (pyridoxamine 5'-phosphate oxidase superfamily)
MKIINGAPGLGKKLNKTQINDFLSSGKMNLQFGTIDDDCEPNIHPVWYIYEKDCLYFATETKSKKVQNIQQRKIAYFAVSNEEEPYVGIRGKGKTTILVNKKQNIVITKKIIKKYLGNKKSKLANEVMDEIESGLEVVVKIKPKYYSAWSFMS